LVSFLVRSVAVAFSRSNLTRFAPPRAQVSEAQTNWWTDPCHLPHCHSFQTLFSNQIERWHSPSIDTESGCLAPLVCGGPYFNCLVPPLQLNSGFQWFIPIRVFVAFSHLKGVHLCTGQVSEPPDPQFPELLPIRPFAKFELQKRPIDPAMDFVTLSIRSPKGGGGGHGGGGGGHSSSSGGGKSSSSSKSGKSSSSSKSKSKTPKVKGGGLFSSDDDGEGIYGLPLWARIVIIVLILMIVLFIVAFIHYAIKGENRPPLSQLIAEEDCWLTTMCRKQEACRQQAQVPLGQGPLERLQGRHPARHLHLAL